MRRLSITWVLILAASIALADVPASQLFKAEGHGRKCDGYFPDDDPRRITAVHDIPTPHISWASPLAGGPVRILAIAAKTDGRWPVELAQRFDFEVFSVYGHDTGHLGAPPDQGLFAQGQRDVEARILKALTADIDVVVSNVAWGALGERVQTRIVSLLGRGIGYVGPTEGLDLKSLTSENTTVASLVAEAVPVEGLRLLREKYGAPEAAAPEILALWSSPDGVRVADLSKYPRDNEKPEFTRLQYDWLPTSEQEAYYSMLGRVILWVARRPFHVPKSIKRNGLDVFSRRDLPGQFAEGVGDATPTRMRIWDADMRLVYESLEPAIPKLPAGRYFVGLESVGGEQFTGWRFEAFEVAAPWAIAELVLTNRRVSLDETVEATVRLADVPPEGSRFAFDVLDNYGRSIHRETREAAQETTFLGNVNESLHLYNYANVMLLDAQETLLSEMRQGFYVARPNAPADDISVMVWEACAGFDPFLRQMLRRFAELGADAALIGGYKGTVDTTYAQACAMSNVHPILYVTRLAGPQVGEDGIRQPTITSEDYKSTLKATLKKQAEAFKPFSPFAYSLGDDQTYVYPGQDVGWSESYRAILATWAQRQYGTIDALNASWGTSYSTFSDVEPIHRSQAIEAVLTDPPDFSDLCHWVDHQLCQDEMLAAWHREMSDVIEAVDPTTVSWYDCTIQGWPQPGTAFDFWELGRQSRFAVQYLNPIVHDILRTVVSKDAYHGTWYGGYGLYNYYPHTDAGFLPWWAVFRGVNLHGLYYGGNSPSYFEERLLCPDLGPTVMFDKILDNLSELRSGTAKLLFNAEKQHDGIAVLYSSPSLHHVALFQEPLPKAREWEGQATAGDEFLYMQEWEGLTLLLRDLGYDFNVVSWKMLEDGSFLDMGYRVLALPLTLRISEAQAETIRKFVEGGGIILADVFTGAFDGRSRLFDGGMLADVFGVRFAPALPGDRLVMDSTELLDGPPLGGMAVDMNVMAKTAQPRAFTASGAPLMFVNHFGKGHTIFLNTLVRDYQIWRTLGTEMPFRAAVGALLNESAGLTPFADIQVEVRGKDTPSHRIQAAEVNRYKLGDGEYVGILRHPKLRPDDSIWMADQRPKPAWVTIPREAHVYDMRRGMYRGFTSRFEDVFYPGRAELYALLPYEVVDILLQTGREENAFVIRGTIVAGEDSAQTTDHVIHLRVRDPRGTDHAELARNVLARQGRFEERLFLGYNASGGLWTVHARDAATGIEKTVVLPVNEE